MRIRAFMKGVFRIAVMALCCSSFGASALVLTPYGSGLGFSLSVFADAFPTAGCCGPLGIGFTPAGGVMVAGYAGRVAVFPTHADGQHYGGAALSATDYGSSSAAGIAQVGGSFYLARQNLGRLDEIDAAGNFVRIVGSVPRATATVANPLNGHVYVSDYAGGIYEVDPSLPAGSNVVQRTFAGTDGLTLSADGTRLYALVFPSTVIGYNTTTFAVEYTSVAIPGGPDGVALGTGSLAGRIYINTNDGHVYEEDLTTHALNAIAELGSRGDFVQVDSSNGTLLITQTDSVWRLTAPEGGGFEGTAPEPASLALLVFGLAGIGVARRRTRR